MSRVQAHVNFVGLLVLLVLLSTPVGADEATFFTFHDRSSVTITGSSTLHDWTCRGPDVRGYLRVNAPAEELRESLKTVHELMAERESTDWGRLASRVSLRVTGPTRVRAAIPVRSMDCGRKAMNEDMYEALKVHRQPALLYEHYGVKNVTVRSAPPPRDGVEYEIQTSGAMAIAGKAKTIDLTLVAHQTGSDTFHFQGKKKLKMSDFDIEPPSALLGLIRAFDDITIHFDITVRIQPGGGVPDVRVVDRELRDMDYEAWLKE